MTLAGEIKTLIAAEGPISLDRYMSLALGHPTLGYYMTRDPFGAAGDFVTAPEISQMFGELLGLWSAIVWEQMGKPKHLRLVELGPGRGTLMTDALRAGRAVPAFRDAIDVHLVEISPVLRRAQEKALSRAGTAVSWHEGFDSVPDGPAIVLANEFFDALPVRHYVRTPRGWHERLVGIDGDRLTFGLAPEPEAALILAAPLGSMLEIGFSARRLARNVAARIAHRGGAALILDYGYTAPPVGETLQAMRGHRFVDPLDAPGEADLTTHVDFTALAQSAADAGAAVHGPISQGECLMRLGLRARADALKSKADVRQAEAIETAVARLAEPDRPGRPGMGEVFKALAFTAPGLPPPPGFPLEATT